MPALDTLANLCILLEIDPSEILCTEKNNTFHKRLIKDEIIDL